MPRNEIRTAKDLPVVDERGDFSAALTEDALRESHLGLRTLPCTLDVEVDNWVCQVLGHVEKADGADAGKPAIGVVVGKPAVDSAIVQTMGPFKTSGLTPGTRYFLARTPGQITGTVPDPTEAGVVQEIGMAETSGVLRLKSPLTFTTVG